MRRIPLRPYPGEIFLFDGFNAFQRMYKKMSGRQHAHKKSEAAGRTVQMVVEGCADTFLVYIKPGASRQTTTVHELAHVALHTFKNIGVHPHDGNGEPFCYLLDRLFSEAMKK